jgi:hypothetical protein
LVLKAPIAKPHTVIYNMPFVDIQKPRLDEKPLGQPPGAFVTPPTSHLPWWKNPVDLGEAALVIAFLILISLLVFRAFRLAEVRFLRYRHDHLSGSSQQRPFEIEPPEFDQALWQKSKEFADRVEPPLPMPEYFEIHLGLIIAISIVIFCGLAGIDVEDHQAALLITAGIGVAIPTGMQYRQRRRHTKKQIERYRQLVSEKQAPQGRL